MNTKHETSRHLYIISFVSTDHILYLKQTTFFLLWATWDSIPKQQQNVAVAQETIWATYRYRMQLAGGNFSISKV